MNEKQQDTQSASVPVDLFTDEEYQNLQSDRMARVVFDGEENAGKTGNLIIHFVDSYKRQKHDTPLEQWLVSEFRRYPTLWKDPMEIESTAREIIVSVQRANDAKESLYAHLDKGKSRESWMAKRVEEGAAAAGVTQVGLYAENLDQQLLEANIKSMDAIYNQREDALGDWEVSANPHMHGFVAEVDVANQFNLNASASHGGVSAEVLGSTGLNSADIVIRDATGKVLQNVQVKSYADVDLAINNIRSHGYRTGTTLLVHENQVERLQAEFPDLKVTSKLEAGGVSSEMPSYERLKKLQYDAQMSEESRRYQWNDVNRISIAKGIGKQALLAAGLVAAMQGVRILGRRVWNKLIGKENPPASEDLKEFFESSIKSAKHVGVQVAVSGAVVVAAKNGWLGTLMRGTPAGQIANAVYVGMENAKILYKLAKGEITGIEAMDSMGNVTCSTVGGLLGAGVGLAKGAAIGSLLGPVGTVVGGFVGSMVGYIAGSKVGEAVYEGGKAILKTAVSVVKTMIEGVKEAAKAVAKILNPLSWFA
jgi:hypothetical protein